MPNETMAQVQDAPEVTTTPTDSPTETKVETTEEPSQGGEATNTPDAENIPFHKHPRWIEKQREIDDLKRQLQTVSTLPNDIKEIREQLTPKKEAEMPEWWKEAFGTDEASKKAFKKHLEEQEKAYAGLEDRVIARIQREAQERQQKEQETVRQWETFIDTEVQKLREKGYTFDRNELLKVVEDYSKDPEGNFTGQLIPFEKAYEILQLKKTAPTPTVVARKTAAAQSVAGTNSASTPSTLPTLTEVRQRGWGGWRTGN